MINLEILRIELNYLKQVVEKELGNKDARKLSEAITALATCFLNPASIIPYPFLTSKQLSSI